MARLACVNAPALPLQWLLRRHLDWRAAPAAVVADERAQSPILWVNARALRAGILPGMRHAAALSLTHALRAGTVPAAEVAAEVKALTRRLQRHSPHVEASREEPGVFWLGAEGLARLHPDPDAWARGIAADLEAAGLRATVAVGFERFALYAVAKAQRGVGRFADPARERRAARAVPLLRLGIAPALRDDLERLGIRTLAELLRLPPVGLLQRFGPPLYRLHRLASGALAEGLVPDPEELPIEEAIPLDDPESDAARLLFLIKGRLEPLLAALRKRRQALKTLHLRLLLEGRAPRESAVRPAAPSRDPALILDLVRLRLESLPLEAGVNGIELLAEGEARPVEQLSLFAARARRDLEAAERALARVRAELGEEAVARARLCDAHRPEAGFSWEPLERLRPPRPAEAEPRLVRRLFAQPRALGRPPPGGVLTPRPPLHGAVQRHVERGGTAPVEALQRFLAQALGGGPLRAVHGPYPLSGEWWGAEWRRDYAFAETRRGDLFWVYRDRRDGQWFLHGRVE